MVRLGAIVLAAGQGRRMGQDKALLQIGDQLAVERVVAACRAAGAAAVRVVRATEAEPLPGGLAELEVRVPRQEMLDSVRAGAAALPADCAAALVFPVDYAMVGSRAARAVADALGDGHQVVLPLHQQRPGHPIGLSRACLEEAGGAIESLRDIVAADPERVHTVPVEDPWVLRDLDTPEDLASARAALRAVTGSTTELMRRHRSVRSFTDEPIPDQQLEWLVDSARYASTSSFIQAYSAIAVCDPVRRAELSRLCSDQRHILEAPVFLAICADLHKVQQCCERHGTTFRGEPIEGFVEALIDASLFAQNLLLAAESEGLAGCLIGAARQRPLELAELLQLPSHVFVGFGLVLGHPAELPQRRGRMPLSAVLHRETYSTRDLPEALAAADEQMRAWARATNTAGGYNGRPVNEAKGWTERMATKWSQGFGPREALAAHLRQLGFGLQ